MTFPPLHVITDDALLADPDFDARTAELLPVGGPRLAMHIRGPRSSGRVLFDRAAAALAHAEGTGARVLVNERVDVARAVGANGVQLSARSLNVGDARTVWPDAWVGCSVHGVDEAVECVRDGTDFLLLGTIWASASHPRRPGAGPALIRLCAAAVAAPIVTIGGIDEARAAEAAAAGARGIAVLGAIWHRGRPAHNVERLLCAWSQALPYAEDGEGE